MSTRRSLLRAAAWTAPAALVAVAAPVVATSQLRDCLVFTNTTATAGRDAAAVYVNTKVMTTGGAPVPGLVVTVSIADDHRTTTHDLATWGATALIRHDFAGQAATGRITVRFHAAAPGCTPITRTATVTPPAWWKETR